MYGRECEKYGKKCIRLGIRCGNMTEQMERKFLKILSQTIREFSKNIDFLKILA